MLSANELLLLEEGLKNSVELRNEKARLERLRNILANQQTSFAPYFASKVMNKINHLKTEAEFSQGIIFAFKRVAIPMLAAAVVLILFSIFSGGSVAFDNFMGIDSLQPQYLSEFLLFNY
jgi:hypothetical protein